MTIRTSGSDVRSRTALQGRAAALILGSLLAAALMGALSGILGYLAFILLFATLGLVWLGYRYRGWWQSVGRSLASASSNMDTSTGAPVQEADRFRFSRHLYYAGMLTSGLLTVRPALGFTLSDWLFVIAALACLVQLAVNRLWEHAPRPRLLMLGGLLLFAVGGLVSSVNVQTAVGNILVTGRLVFLTVIWISLGCLVLTNVRHLRTAVVCWTTSAAVCGAGAAAQTIFGDVIPGGYVSYGRMTGFTQNVNTLGGFALVAAIPAIWLLIDQRRLRAPAAVILIFILFGLIASGSVGSALALIAGLAFFLLSWPNGRRALNTTIASAVTVSLLLLITAAMGIRTPVDRFPSTIGIGSTTDSPSTLGSRLSTDGLAWERVLTDPLRGVGLDLQNTITESGHPVHNLFLGTWYTAGVFGFLGVCLMVFAAVAITRQAVGSSSASNSMLTRALVAAAIAAFVFAMKEPVLYQRYCWMPIALLAVVATQGRNAIAGLPAFEEIRSVREDLRGR